MKKEEIDAIIAEKEKELHSLKSKLREFTKAAHEMNPNLRITFDGELTSDDLDSLKWDHDMEDGIDFSAEDKNFYFMSDGEARKFFEQVCPKLSVRCSIGYPPEKGGQP
jgi:hypothetical protein